MTIEELIVQVKEENLSKSRLELYRDHLTALFSELKLEQADLEKKEALFVLDGATEAALVRAWRKTENGQRLIEVKHHVTIINKLWDSVKSRLYTLY